MSHGDQFPRKLVAESEGAGDLPLRDRPENGRQVLVVFLAYAAILVLLSLPFVVLKWPSSMGWMVWPYNTWPFGL